MSAYLLDTHTWLWLCDRPERCSAECPLKLNEPPDAYILRYTAQQRIDVAPIEMTHALAAAALPPLHRDPFDRLLVAQAQALDAVLVTADRQIAAYDVEVLDPTA